MERLKMIDKLKNEVMKKEIKSASELEKRFMDVIQDFWGSFSGNLNESMYHEELGGFGEYHKKLLEEVKNIHINERSIINEEIFKKEISFRGCIERAEHGKSGCGIYSFNREGEYIFIGDIHSDFASLMRSLQAGRFFENVVEEKKQSMIFLGDYVDRGGAHLKCMEGILSLKYIFPERIFLLRGNHDGGKILDHGEIKTPYGIPKTDPKEWYFPHYLRKLSKENSSFSEEMLGEYLDFFDSLSYVAVVEKADSVLMGVHGGVPRPYRDREDRFNYIKSISDITNEKIKDELDRTIVQNIMWSDPWEKEEDLKEESGRFRFTESDFESYAEKIGIDLLVRGHQAEKNGHKLFFKNRVVTVFSSGALLKENNLESAYEEVTPHIMVVDNNGKKKFL